MTSIGNDAFTVGTAAVAAGGANIIAQKKNAIISAATTTKDAFVKGAKASVTKEPYVNLAKAAYKPVEKMKGWGRKIKEAFKNSATIQEALRKLKDDTREVTIQRIKNLKAEKLMKKLDNKRISQMAKDSAFNISEESNKYFAKNGIKFPTLKNKIKDFGTKTIDKVKSVNWKRAGKYAVVAAGIATALVVAKNLLFSKNEDVEEV